MKTKTWLCVSVSAIVGFAGTPAWAQTAQGAPMPTEATDASINPASPDGDEQPPADDIVVTGLRRSLESAQNIKRTSDGIVDAVVAEDIGKLPDTFASSALQRVPGVGVTRGGGEAAGVTVRGLPDLTTTYNGRQIFTAEGRYVAIQDFPAGTVAALEVYKSGVANQIEAGIAGAVNVRGRKPFDFKGFELSGSVNGVQWEQSQKYSWNGNLLISDRWDTGIGEMGFLINGSYVGLNFLDSTREQSLVIGTTDANNAPGQEAGLRFPDAQGNFMGYGDRWRPSVNAAFQWRPSPELEVYVDGLFQGFRSKDYNRWMFNPIFGGITLSNVTKIPGTNKVASATVSGAVRPDGYYGSVNGKTDTYQIGGGAIWKKDRLELSADVAYTDSRFTLDLVNLDYAFADSPVRNVQFEVPQDGGPSQQFLNYSINNPANFISRGFYQEYLDVRGKDWQARGDISYDLDMGFLKRIQAGIRYSDRDASRDFGNAYIYNEPARVPISALPVDISNGLPGFTYNDAMPNRSYASITRDSIRANLPELRSFYGAPAGRPGFDPIQNFRANEKSYAGYAQLKYGFDLGSMVVDGLVGLRAVKTKTRVDTFSNVGAGVVPASAENEYTDYLPNFSARVGFTDKLQLRLAFTETRTRPNFIDLRPNLTLGSPPNFPPNSPCLDPTSAQYNSRACARGGSQGNPDLKPLTSNNYDASLEWYFSRTGSFTAAIFRHDAKGFLATVNTVSRDPTLGLIAVDRPVNLGNTRIQGAEVSFTSFLDFEGIPDWAKGFGIQANGTYLDGKGDLIPAFAATYGGAQQRFPGISKWAYNVIALYERPKFSARLAYNYRSEFVNYYSLEPLDPIAHGVTEKGRGQLDASATVTPIENITIAFDVVNLLGNPLQRYRPFNTGDSFTRQILYLERTYSLGIRFRF